MFCGECGTKNKNGDMFCSNCGAKLEQNEIKTNNTVPKEKKPMSKKTKIILIIVAVLAVALGVSYKVLSDMTSPKTIAKEFIDAVVNKNADKLYKYLEVEGDKTFVTKKIFKEVMKNTKLSSEIENYKITDVDYGSGNLTATVRFSYTNKSGSERTDGVKVAKQKDKKFLIFDNWKVADVSFDSMIVKEFTLKVPKDAKLVYAEIEVDSKYLDKDASTSTQDVYVLPQVFSAKAKVEVTLKNGMKLNKEVTPSTYYKDYTISFDRNSLTDDEKTKLVDDTKEIIGKLYNSAIDSKKYDDIKDNYSKLSKDFEDDYNDFVEDLESASTKLTSITFTSGSLYDVDLTDDGNIEVEVKLNYDYKVEYTSLGETKTSEKSNYGYMTIVVTDGKDGYELVNIKNLKTYFYR